MKIRYETTIAITALILVLAGVVAYFIFYWLQEAAVRRTASEFPAHSPGYTAASTLEQNEHARKKLESKQKVSASEEQDQRDEENNESRTDSVEKIDLNTASETELATIPGIGAVLAKRIVRYRQISGGYKTTDELLRVKGIGQKKLQAILPYVKVE